MPDYITDILTSFIKGFVLINFFYMFINLCIHVGKAEMRFLKHMCQKCWIHEWKKNRYVCKYHDYSGYTIYFYDCICSKCGKHKIKKFY